MGTRSVVRPIAVSLITLLLISASWGSASAEEAKLPKTLLFSCYDVGASGYMQASAIADAFSKKWGTRIRLLPSGTSIGRLMPLAAKRVEYGFLADEVYFAVEGIYDFAVEEWGPQDLRVVLAHPSTIAIATTKECGVKTLYDLKGKRVAYIPGAPTLNIKAEAFLAFAGLTWDDVKRVEFPSYGASCKALIEGNADAAVVSPAAPLMYELDSSPRGLHWLEFPADDTEGWKRMHKIAPFLSPYMETIGPGMSKDKPAALPAYRYPMITVYADADPETIYQFTKAMDESYPLYLPTHAVMEFWKVQDSGIPPAAAPFHEGAIRYLKDVGVWKPEHDVWNNNRIEHMKKLQKAWDETMEEKQVKKIETKNFADFWMKKRAEVIGD